jgi:hypothetical protein
MITILHEGDSMEAPSLEEEKKEVVVEMLCLGLIIIF